MPVPDDFDKALAQEMKWPGFVRRYLKPPDPPVVAADDDQVDDKEDE